MSHKRYESLDLAKFFAAVCIIAIHTALFEDVNVNLNILTVQIISRLAVPVFAMTTGFLLSAKFSKEYLIGYWKKTLKLYLIWSCIYLCYSIPSWVASGWFSVNAFKDFLVATFFTAGSHYHFWYLIALIYAIPLFYFCRTKLNNRSILILLSVLHVIQCLNYAYFPLLGFQLDNMNWIHYFGALKNSMICILPFMLMGLLIEERFVFIQNSRLGLILSFIGLMMEGYGLRYLGSQGISYIFMTLPMATFLFMEIIQHTVKIPGLPCRMLGNLSLYMYCVHPIIIEISLRFIKSSVILFLSTVFISIIISYLILILCQNMRRIHLCLH